MRRVHALLGLSLGLLLAAVGLSGSVLVFADQLQAASRPAITWSGEPDLDLCYRAVQSRYPEGWGLRFLRLPRTATQPVMLTLNVDSPQMKADRLDVAVHPSTGEILAVTHALGRYEPWRNPVGWVRRFHSSLLCGRTGQQIVCALSIALLLTNASGLLLHMRRMRAGERFRGLHSVLGVATLPVTTVLAITGFWMTRYAFSAAVSSFPGPHPASSAAAPSGFNAAFLRLRAKHADFTPIGTSPVSLRDGSFRVYGRFKDEAVLLGSSRSQIWISDTSEPGESTRISWAPAAERIEAMVIPIHFGGFGGTSVKVIWAIAGITPGLLACTGWLIWRRRKRADRSGPNASPFIHQV